MTTMMDDILKAIAAPSGSDVLPAVEYDITIEGLPAASVWRVRSVAIDEDLSVGYKAVIELESETPFAEVNVLLGADACLTLRRPGHSQRRFSGLLRQVTFHGRDVDQNAHCTVELEPAFACLDENVETRRFQDMTVPQILGSVLKEGLGGFARRLDFRLIRHPDGGGEDPPGDTYPARPWCVQYGESAHDFARRLMGEEGLSYFFENHEGPEKLVIVDSNVGFPKVEGAIPVRPTGGFVPDREAITAVSIRTQRSPGRVTLRARNMTAMNPELEAAAMAAEDDGSSTRQDRRPAAKDGGREEVYVGAAPVTLHRYERDSYSRSDIETQARLRLEEKRAFREVALGSGYALGLQAGVVVTIDDESMRGEYLVTRVRHVGHASSAHHSESVRIAGPNYENEFECIPARTPFRPPRLPKPLAQCYDRAEVTAPGDHQIWTDSHGRITVRFCWDREDDGPRDMTSCWIPVAFPWAGAGYGVQFIPRKGMQVLVGYVNGDPDQPIVVGCCESALTPPLAPTPRESPKSGMRTHSLRDDGRDHEHYSEISLDDTPNHEKVFVRAGRDFQRKVLNDEKIEIDGNQQVTVKGARQDRVVKDEVRTIHGKRTLTVDEDCGHHVHGAATETVDRDQTVAVRGARTVEVTGRSKHVAHGHREVLVEGKDDLHVVEDRTVRVDKTLTVKQAATVLEYAQGHVDLNAESWIRIRHAGAEIYIDQSGKVQIATDQEVEIGASGASITLGNGKVAIEATQELTLGAGTGALKLDGSGAALSGQKVSTSGTSMNEIVGPIVKVN